MKNVKFRVFAAEKTNPRLNPRIQNPAVRREIPRHAENCGP